MYCFISIVLVIVLISISLSHFVPPLGVCLLADICNHTWIPECGLGNNSDTRLFLDECDLFEYNCDYNATYTKTVYAECFRVTCPQMPICPECPSCPHFTHAPIKGNISKRSHSHVPHRHQHLRGGHYGHHVHATAKKPLRTHGRVNPNKRRYTVKPGRKIKKKPVYRKKAIKTSKMVISTTTKMLAIRQNIALEGIKTSAILQKNSLITAKNPIRQTTILKKMTVLRNGKMFMKVIKGYSN